MYLSRFSKFFNVDNSSNTTKKEIKSTTVAIISTTDLSVDILVTLEYYPLSELGLRNGSMDIRYFYYYYYYYYCHFLFSKKHRKTSIPVLENLTLL